MVASTFAPTCATTGARRLDGRSRAWLDALGSRTERREQAIASLHALLLREARFEVARRAAPRIHPRGADLDDLAMEVADDAVVAILRKLDQFRGESLFTTWARRFVQREAPAKLRRHTRRARELPSGLGFEDPRDWPVDSSSSHDRAAARESVRTVLRLIAEELTPRQRAVVIALAVEGTPARDLARRLDTTTGALYKALHDARRVLRAGFADADGQSVRPSGPACGRLTAAV